MRKFIRSNAQLSWLLIAFIAIAVPATFVLSASAEDPSTLTIPGKAPEVDGDKAPAEYVSIHVDGGAMRQVLNSFAMQANRNIVLSPEVTNDSVTIHLNNVQWDNALDVILKPYGYGYRQVGDAIVVGELERLKTLEAVEPLQSRVYELRYLDANDVKDIIEGQLSARGKMSIITARGQKGWKNLANRRSRQGSGATLEMREREGEEEQIRSKTIVISDVPSVLDRVDTTLSEIDQMPKQVLVEARFMEVNEDFLRDIGVEMSGSFSIDGADFGLADQFFNATPNAFGPKSEGVTGERAVLNGLRNITTNATAALVLTPAELNLNTFGQLSAGGRNWGLLISMLEEDEDTKTLSAPKILTLNNQEAAIVVGTRYPIISSTTSSGNTSDNKSEELEYYESIGIQLNVVPQICADGYINMVARPSVTEIIGFTGANDYPIIKTRDTETQILVENGETIAIGGLLEERETEGVFKVPFLGDIPIIGRLFRRDTKDTKTIDLLIFLKATIIDEENYDLIKEQPEVEEVVMIDVPADEMIEVEEYTPMVLEPTAPAEGAESVEDIMAELE